MVRSKNVSTSPGCDHTAIRLSRVRQSPVCGSGAASNRACRPAGTPTSPLPEQSNPPARATSPRVGSPTQTRSAAWRRVVTWPAAGLPSPFPEHPPTRPGPLGPRGGHLRAQVWGRVRQPQAGDWPGRANGACASGGLSRQALPCDTLSECRLPLHVGSRLTGSSKARTAVAWPAPRRSLPASVVGRPISRFLRGLAASCAGGRGRSPFGHEHRVWRLPAARPLPADQLLRRLLGVHDGFHAVAYFRPPMYIWLPATCRRRSVQASASRVFSRVRAAAWSSFHRRSGADCRSDFIACNTFAR